MSTSALAIAYGAGVLAALNPCGFALLPAWIGRITTDPGALQGHDVLSRVLRSLRISGLFTLGFAAAIGPLGFLASIAIARAATTAPWLGVAAGLVLLAIGGIQLSGRRIPLPTLPRFRLNAGGASVNLAGYGVAYATVSLSCTLPAFLIAVSSAAQSRGTARPIAFAAYALGTGTIITIVTVATLTAAGTITPLLRRASRHANRISAVLLVIAGAYIAANDLRLALINHGTLLSSRLPILTATGAGAIVATLAIARHKRDQPSRGRTSG